MLAGSESRFGRVPEHYVFSDYISDHGLRIIAYIDASKSDHSGFGRGMRWPVCSMPELAAVINKSSERTARLEVSKLRNLGLIETTKTLGGNRYVLTGTKIAGDTYRGRENLKENRYVHLTIDTITCDVSSTALRLWMIIDRIRGTHAYAHISQETLASYLGCSPRTVIRHLNALRESGLVTVRHERNWNGYDLNCYKPLSFEESLKRKAYRLVTRWLRGVAGDWRAWKADHEYEFMGLLGAVSTAIQRHGFAYVASVVEELLSEQHDPMVLLAVLNGLSEHVKVVSEESAGTLALASV